METTDHIQSPKTLLSIHLFRLTSLSNVQQAAHTGGVKNAGKSKKGLNKRGQFFKLDEIQE